MQHHLGILETFAQARLLVLGDVMLDRYVCGEAERVSPEAPVLILRADEDEVRPGGAASVAFLGKALGAAVSVGGIVGADSNGQTLRRLLIDERVDHDALVEDCVRPTTCKERFVGRTRHGGPQQMLRVDREVREPLTGALEERLAAVACERLSTCDVLLVSDYGKGVCTPHVLTRVLSAAAERGVPAIVDPARGADYRMYSGARMLVPNRYEAETATAALIDSPEEAGRAAQHIRRTCGAESVVVKLDRDGMVLVEGGCDHRYRHFPTRARTVYDVTGAGDMVLAVLGLCAAQQTALPDAISLANVAAGLEVERLGVATVSRDEIARELRLESGENLQSIMRGT